MAYIIGSYTIPDGSEPERWDLTTSNTNETYPVPFEPFSMMDNTNLGPSSLVVQGYTTSRTIFESIMAQYKKGGEIVCQMQEWDGTARRLYGIAGGQARESKVGQRKGVYDYLMEFICADPYKYDTTIQYDGFSNVNTSDVAFTAASGELGTIQSYPIFVLKNSSGGALANFKFYAGDGGSSITGNNIEISLGSFANNTTRIIHPILYDTLNDVYVLRSALTRSGTTTDITSEDLRVTQLQNSAISGVASGNWPEYPSGGGTIHCKTSSGTNVSVGLQWHAAY